MVKMNASRYQQMLDDLAKKGYHDFLGVHKELKYLSDKLPEDEELLAAVRGYSNGNHTVLCALTFRRIIFLNLGMVYGVQSSDVPLKKVNGISHDSGLVFCSLIVTNGADNIVVKQVLIKDADMFVKAVNYQLSSHDDNNPATIADTLFKYQQLLNQNLITQADFDKQRDKLLGKPNQQ